MTQYSKRLMTRIGVDILLFAGVFLLPWWAVLLSSIALFFVFEHFVEMLIAALLMDFIYAVSLPRFLDFEFVLSLLSVVLYSGLTVVKKRVRF